ncbi:MAG: hypothetical protein PV344_08500 [Anaplasma sp.]|nr:hypothetical protein [Anaplasma sp.]
MHLNYTISISYLTYCKRLNFRGLKFLRMGPNLRIWNYSWVLIFANRM